MVAPKPILKKGSYGQFVLLLQKALNYAPSNQAKLAEDSSFGPKTDARTREFQSKQNIASDGVVGPITWESLDPFVQMVTQAANLSTVNTEHAEARDRIVKAAEDFLAKYSWSKSPLEQGDCSVTKPSIAAMRGVGPMFQGPNVNGCITYHQRQGGLALMYIYKLAGIIKPQCLIIPTKVIKLIESGVVVPVDPKDPDRQTLNNDIGAWCGIFATACYKVAGLNVNWHVVKKQLSSHFQNLTYRDKFLKGDIGVYNPGAHHFVIIKDSEPGSDVKSIDGNVCNVDDTKGRFNSVIGRRTYTRDFLMKGNINLLRPKFDAMIAPPPEPVSKKK